MNYIDYVKLQIIIYIPSISAGSIAYGIGIYFECGKPILLTSGHVGAFVGGTLSHIFLVPLCCVWFNSLKK